MVIIMKKKDVSKLIKKLLYLEDDEERIEELRK